MAKYNSRQINCAKKEETEIEINIGAAKRREKEAHACGSKNSTRYR